MEEEDIKMNEAGPCSAVHVHQPNPSKQAKQSTYVMGIDRPRVPRDHIYLCIQPQMHTPNNNSVGR